jgi:hypothetical protein
VVSKKSGRGRQFLLAMSNGATIKKTSWSSDVVLVNPGDQPMTATLRFVPVAGAAAKGKTPPQATKTVTIQPTQTVRLIDVLTTMKVKIATGVLVVESAGAGGEYPLVLGETMNVVDRKKVYGQTVQALDDRDAARANQSQMLLGLREDAAYKTTFWFHNPSAEAATVQLTYRSLDGVALNSKPVTVAIPAGKALQVQARNGGALPKTFSGTFTVEAKVIKGQLLSGAQVVNKANNDPAFIVGLNQP